MGEVVVEVADHVRLSATPLTALAPGAAPTPSGRAGRGRGGQGCPPPGAPRRRRGRRSPARAGRAGCSHWRRLSSTNSSCRSSAHRLASWPPSPGPRRASPSRPRPPSAGSRPSAPGLPRPPAPAAQPPGKSWPPASGLPVQEAGGGKLEKASSLDLRTTGRPRQSACSTFLPRS